MQEYTYLGVKLTASGSFTLAQKRLSEKALRAFFKNHRHLSISKISVKLATKLFDTMVFPILAYGTVMKCYTPILNLVSKIGINPNVKKFI